MQLSSAPRTRVTKLSASEEPARARRPYAPRNAGFRGRLLTEPRDDKSFAFLVFEDEAAARAAAPAPGAAAGDRVTIEDVDFREIQANT